MKHPLSFVGGLLAGALAMYYLDAQGGARRRALLRDKLVAAAHDAADAAQGQTRLALDRARGLVATRRLDRRTRREPESDRQLHDRIRARLGHLVSHPRAVQVSVEAGCVRLSGRVSRRELQRLLWDVRDTAGVRELRTELQVHDGPDGFPVLHGQPESPASQPSPAGTAWH